MVKVIIQHGSFGSPEENWFPWLKNELEKLGVEAISPKMPIDDEQTLTSWLSEYRKVLPVIDENTILIGHSIAPAFFMSLLEERKTAVKGVFLVCGFLHDIKLPEYDKVNATFYKKEFDWKKIKKLAGKIYFYSGDNDPYVPFKYQKQFADNLRVSQIIIPGAGHFNTSSGYSQFPRLLEDIKSLL